MMLGELLRAIDGFSGQFVTFFALKLAPLVFVRPSELRGHQQSAPRGYRHRACVIAKCEEVPRMAWSEPSDEASPYQLQETCCHQF